MVTASHNAPNMNGIKIMNNLGYKLSDQEEGALEEVMDECHLTPSNEKGSICFAPELLEKYEQHILSFGGDLHGLTVALDCANGSNFALAPKMFQKLGANIIPIHCKQDGSNINVNCGALHPEQLKQEVLTHGCDIGFAFDGDADRLVVILPNGKELMGDELLYLFANHFLKHDQLNSLTVVGTIMTNLGCEESLNELGVHLVRVDVGDKNVIEKMREKNFALGGESSGHICVKNYNTTCDALMNALLLLKVLNNKVSNANNLLLSFKRYGNVLKNLPVTAAFRKTYNENTDFHNKLQNIIALYPNVKLIVRPSGTESVLRIFAESADQAKNQKAVCQLERFIKNYLKVCCEKT